MATATQPVGVPDATEPQRIDEVKEPEYGIEEPISEPVSEEEKQRRVSELAHRYWEERGCPDGCAEDDWFRAERDLYM